MPDITTVGHLIEHLRTFDVDDPIAVATQPSWPVRYGLVTTARAADGTVHLVTNEEASYLSAEVCRTLGW
jgi:hypothetical protein